MKAYSVMEGAQNGTTASVLEYRKINISYTWKTILGITYWNGSAIAAKAKIRKPPKGKHL